METEELAKKENNKLAVVQAAERQKEVEAAIILANKFKRDESLAYERLMASCKRKGFAETTTYSFPRGGKKISGPSVNIAREAARCYGNLRYGLDIVQEDEESITIQAWAWDMETNTRVSQEDKFKKLIYRKKGGWITPDERDLRELVNRRGAIVLRNCLLQILPKDFIDDAISQATRTLLKGVKESPEEQLKSMQMAFKGDFNVSVEMIEKYLGHPLKECSPEELVDLRQVYMAIRDGQANRDDYFKTSSPTETKTTTLNNLDDLKAGDPETHQGHESDNTLKPDKDEEGDPDGPIDDALMTRLFKIMSKLNGYEVDEESIKGLSMSAGADILALLNEGAFDQISVLKKKKSKKGTGK
ncbi:MAG: hypothetical protein Unbinned7913contig1002_10 [Prokaryotic dsDNA virus sp.]|jgi:hypothetical protein|nr:MAG: hypothetical protein Unbinned7913contig1002_10 [Prokaryotic dsDNA virus sp.]|tara:strand:+ start:2107 stop:3183 length:1077 start_codon:yes stop_codon:yes gene_type:complete